jgi:hypothetical protein
MGDKQGAKYRKEASHGMTGRQIGNYTPFIIKYNFEGIRSKVGKKRNVFSI